MPYDHALRGIAGGLCLLVSTAWYAPPAPAQQAPDPDAGRLHVVPALSLGTQGPTLGRGGVPPLAALTLGVQIERAGSSRWTPLLASQLWHFPQGCLDADLCGSAWSADAGILYSLHPHSLVRLYSGSVLGFEWWKEAGTYVQSRAGVDVVLPRSTTALRLEARHHSFLGTEAGTRGLFLLTTGFRLLVPAPRIRSPASPAAEDGGPRL